MTALLERLTLEETVNLKQHRVFRAVLRLLLQEINATRAFEAALVGDLLREVNVVRETLLLPALTAADLTAKPPPPLTVAQVLAAIKGNL